MDNPFDIADRDTLGEIKNLLQEAPRLNKPEYFKFENATFDTVTQRFTLSKSKKNISMNRFLVYNDQIYVVYTDSSVSPSVIGIGTYDIEAEKLTEIETVNPPPSSGLAARQKTDIGDGRVFLAGNNGIFLYDIESNQWLQGAVPPNTISSGVFYNGEFFAFGCSADYKGTQIYNYQTNAWRQVKASSERADSSSCIAYNKKIYVMGGTNASTYASLKNIQIYTVSTNSWTTKTQSTVAISGGAYTNRVDLSTGAAVSRAAPPTNVVKDFCCAFNGEIHLINKANGTVQIYNTVANQWRTGTPAPHGLSQASGAFAENKFYFFDRSGELLTYDPNMGTWEITLQMAPLTYSALKIYFHDGIFYAVILLDGLKLRRIARIFGTSQGRRTRRVAAPRKRLSDAGLRQKKTQGGTILTCQGV